MQRKKFLALMLTAALVGQPGAPVSIMAAETDESSDFQKLLTQQKKNCR